MDDRVGRAGGLGGRTRWQQEGASSSKNTNCGKSAHPWDKTSAGHGASSDAEIVDKTDIFTVTVLFGRGDSKA